MMEWEGEEVHLWGGLGKEKGAPRHEGADYPNGRGVKDMLEKGLRGAAYGWHHTLSAGLSCIN